MCIISPQGICASEGYKGNFVASFHGENDSSSGLNLKDYKPGWHKAEPLEGLYIKYNPNNILRIHECVLHNHRDKNIMLLSRDVCVTNKADHNLTPSHKDLL